MGDAPALAPNLPPVQSPPQVPVQPPLIATLSGGILTYCGLMVAGVVALMATDRFTDLGILVRITGTATTIASLFGGSLALLSLATSINYARRVERGATQPEIDSARRWSMGFGNVSLYSIAAASIAAGALITFYAFSDPKSAPGADYLLDLSDQSAASAASPKVGLVTCYTPPKRASNTLPARVCIFTPQKAKSITPP